MSSVARRERQQLCDLALELGPSAPTLCGEWDVRELVAHLVVRERSLIGAPGILVPALERLTDKRIEKVARTGLSSLVRRLRNRRTPLALPLVDELVNTLEFFVHHEDIRRAQHRWEPRPLDEETRDTLWRAIRVAGPGLTRKAGVPVTIRRTDTGRAAAIRRGADPVVVAGPVPELVLFLYGRRQTVELEFTGPPPSVRQLQHASLGI